MSRPPVDKEKARQGVEAVKNKEESIWSAAARFGINPTSIANRVTGRVALGATCGPQIVLTTEEETTIEHLLVYAGRQLGENVRKLCNDGRRVPWDPLKGPGKAWLAAFFKRYPRLTLRSSRIYEANRVSADDRTRLDAFYDTRQEFCDTVQPSATHIWNTDKTGANPQGTKSQRIGVKRSDSRENFTIKRGWRQDAAPVHF